MKIAFPLAKTHFNSIRNNSICFSNWCRNSKEIHRSGVATLIISNKKMNDRMIIVEALEYSNILLIGVTKTIKNEKNEQKGGFLSMLFGTLGASLLGNILTEKRVIVERLVKDLQEQELRFNDVFSRDNLPKTIK